MLRRILAAAERANTWLAVLITRAVGTMWMAYLFALLALSGLPQALKPGGPGLVQWFAQTFLQLVLLSVIIVGQNVQAAESQAQARAENARTELLLRNQTDMMRAQVAMMQRIDNRTERIEDIVDALDGEPGQAGPMRREEG